MKLIHVDCVKGQLCFDKLGVILLFSLKGKTKHCRLGNTKGIFYDCIKAKAVSRGIHANEYGHKTWTTHGHINMTRPLGIVLIWKCFLTLGEKWRKYDLATIFLIHNVIPYISESTSIIFKVILFFLIFHDNCFFKTKGYLLVWVLFSIVFNCLLLSRLVFWV